jgi:Uri superfamily endonuclease
VGGGPGLATPDRSLEAHGQPGFPRRPGTYALLLRLKRARAVAVGRLGHFRFPAGTYVYVGSARGPGGLAARVARHLRRSKPLRWHVDYLRPWGRPLAVWLVEGDQQRECLWASTLAATPGASVPAPGFGASDCGCPAHLLHFPDVPDRAAFAQQAGGPVTEVHLDG